LEEMNSKLNFFESEKILYSLWFVVRELRSEGERLKALYKKKILEFSDLGNASGRWERLEDLYTERRIFLENCGLDARQKETLDRIGEDYSSVLAEMVAPSRCSLDKPFFAGGKFPDSDEEEEEDLKKFERYLVLVRRGGRRK
jgi:hypothetical protein